MYAIPVKQYVQRIGILNRWAILGAILFVFGFQKHMFEYYVLVGSGYCKRENNCEIPSIGSLSLDTAFYFYKNIWVSAFWEGMLFVVVGFPLAIAIKEGYVVAFLTGTMSHIVVQLAGINSDICATNCIQRSE
jgi:hypothetical protein